MNWKKRFDLLFIALVSAAVLAYELMLTRILSVRYWSYFAAMIVSLAMLGFAASGTALFLLSRRKRGTAPLIPWIMLGFAASIPLVPLLSQRIECMPLTILWNPRQFLLFAANYLVLSLPFFLGGFVVGHFFTSGTPAPGRVYFANMAGSGIGILLALTLLGRIPPRTALFVAAAPAALAAAIRARGPVLRLLMAAVLGLTALAAFQQIGRAHV